ncbi:LysR family transcriptional regulator [Shewanella schlegeliana]|uniref:LysR family transcriptional regulator n=1 Tax=Shewanella schlegeliana TaxID=190308 RepID=A0ABS1SX97_9GAMM|nr:LysR family transcriptional regulator [Shewanella schlegeliana]MBL4913132.1 LysR family transcriptional regulator [Shewanella schlegeliana]MCL1111146.1 LysR family transcriptional regulator [Shewanella schlegeliana]GIU28106.1 LysR family transcriptional regulator [Shewanella schlegeliana]
MLNPIWLHTFKTLIDTGHFTQTAEKLHMTQPGVSQQVKKLEQACGHELIKRFNKQFEITEQGRQVYQYAIESASNEAKLIENLNFDDPYSGLCSLSCSGALALLYYPELLKLQQRHPALSIHLEAAPNHKILEEIADGKIDLGLVTHKPNINQFHSIPIGLEPLCLIFPKDYEDKPLDSNVLNRCGIVKHPDADHYLSLYFDQCESPEFIGLNIETLPTASYVNQLSQILLPVSMGLGFTVLPKSAFDSFFHKERLSVHMPKTAVTEQVYLVHKRNRQLPTRYQILKKLLKHCLSNCD